MPKKHYHGEIYTFSGNLSHRKLVYELKKICEFTRNGNTVNVSFHIALSMYLQNKYEKHRS